MNPKYRLTSALKMEQRCSVPTNMCLGSTVYVPWKQDGQFYYKKVNLSNLGFIEYKKLQKVAAMLRLPGNLKRKQLVASIVARKKGREDVVDAIIHDVDRERKMRKLHKHKISQCISEKKNPKGALISIPIDNVFNRNTGKFLRPRPIYNNPYGESSQKSILDSIDLTVNDQDLNNESPNSLNGFLSEDSALSDRAHINYPHGKFYSRKLTCGNNSSNDDSISVVSSLNERKRTSVTNDDTSSTYSAFSPAEEQYCDVESVTELELLRKPVLPARVTTSITTTTSGIISTRSTSCYFNVIPTAYVQQSTVNTPYNIPLPPMPLCTFHAIKNFDINIIISDKPAEVAHTVTTLCKDNQPYSDTLTGKLSTDVIDGINGNIEALSPNNIRYRDPEELLINYQNIEIANLNKIGNLQKCIIPTSRVGPTLPTFVYTNSFSSSNCAMEVCYSTSLHPIAHATEVKSRFKIHPCIFQPSSMDVPHPASIPTSYLLHPVDSLSYRVPHQYVRSNTQQGEESGRNILPFINTNSNASHLQPEQIQYNIHLPATFQAADSEALQSAPRQLQTLRPQIKAEPRVANCANVTNLEASIPVLSSFEEAYVYKSIGDADINFTEIYNRMNNQHVEECTVQKMHCPYYNVTQCYWYETLAMMPQHLRTMHPEKIVHKCMTDYSIKYMHLEMLKNMGVGVNIVQEYKQRMYYISMWAYNDNIYITIQEFCETLDQHPEKTPARLMVKHVSGYKVWWGDAHPMHVPLSKLWRPESALVIPITLLRAHKSEYFRLTVQIKP